MTPDDLYHSSCWTPEWVREHTNGTWLVAPSQPSTHLEGISIDSRTVRQQEVFWAIKGERFDGHDFVIHALQKGAAMVVVDRADAVPKDAGGAVLLVDDTIQAMQRLASSYRDQLRQANCTIIGVVGSNGKTTTRHLIHAVLSTQFRGTQSPKSFNNHIGVPLTLLRAGLGDRFLVAEAGTNHPGEIAWLGRILRPDAVVVTCIGLEHVEHLGDIQGVAEEEASITSSIPPEGVVFVEKDARKHIISASSYRQPAKLISFGHGRSGAKEVRTLMGRRQRFAIGQGIDVDLPLLAWHDVNNALAAVAVGRWMGVHDEKIKQALEQVTPMPGRLEVKSYGPITVIDDTYNANPDSVASAIDVLAEFPIPETGRRVAVLGDMLELGRWETDAHREVGRSLARLIQDGRIHRVFLIGARMDHAAKVLGDADGQIVTHHPTLTPTAKSQVVEALRAGDVVLCKASRGIQLEQMLPAIQDRFREMTAR
ncbi:MAG: UDP-N-acetylmuramoyl-tripeptide--D-alanyl-D-alanine ligase [Phycisphaeraceae bacterium]